jgi:hypothetical protein
MLTRARLIELLDYDAGTGIFRWRSPRGPRPSASIAGIVDAQGYAKIVIDYKPYLAHRLAWFCMTGEWPDGTIDHANGNRDDNRFSNLRSATYSQNQWNARTRVDNSSGLKGASFHKRAGRWMATICVNRKQHYLGLHDTPEAAHAAYCEAARKHFGEFARPA